MSNDEYSGPERRQDAIQNLHRRMDTQDAILSEIRDKIVSHIAEEAPTRKALEDLVVLWRGSKIIIPTLVAIIVTTWAGILWFKEHVKL